MAVGYRFLLCALLASFVAAQAPTAVNASSSAISSSASVGSSASGSSVVSTSSAPPPSSSTAAPSSSSAVTTSAAPSSSSTPPSSSVTTPPPSSSTLPPSSSSSPRASSTASNTPSSSPSARSTTPSDSPSPTSSPIVTTSSVPPSSSISSTAIASTVTTSQVISSTETSRAASPSATTTTPPPPPPPSSSSSSSTPPPPASTSSPTTARSSAPTSSKITESSAYVFSSVSSSVIQSTVVSTNAVIITTQGQNGQITQSTSYTVVVTTVPATTLYATTVVTSVESPTGIAGLQAQAIGGSDGSGLSTGAKAGIGAGVAVLVVAAAIFGALFAMRRRRKNKDRIAGNDRYPPSSTPSFFGVGAFGKRTSRFTESEIHSSHSPPMREADPLDRYATPGMSASGRTTLPPNSRTSDISSVTGSEPTTYRPGPGMPVVAEYQRNHGQAEELPEQNRFRSSNSYTPAAGYSEASGNPFHEKSGNDTPSLYSNDGDDGPRRYPSQRQASPAALELSGENTLVGSLSQSSGGYRGMDPEQPYHTRAQLTKPLSQQRQFDPSHNF